MDFQIVRDLVEKYSSISIFRHISPDGDAVFSSLGLKQFIIDNYPEKDVKIAGSQIYDVCPYVEQVDDEYIKNSLAIVVDTSDTERVDDERFISAKEVIKIDHHPALNQFGTFNYVNQEKAACAEFIADILFSDVFKNFVISKKCAEYLYCGILTDTINFVTTNTTAETLYIASKLASKGLNVSGLSDYVLTKKIEEFTKITNLRNYLKIENHFGYVFLEDPQLEAIGLKYDEAKRNVSEFSNISELNIWATIVYNNVDNYYEASLRSKRGFYVNEVARKYRGGGHDNAAGIRGISKQEALSLIEDLKQLSK